MNKKQFIKILENISEISKNEQSALTIQDKRLFFRQKNKDLSDFPVINRYFKLKERLDTTHERVVPISTELINDYNQKTGSNFYSDIGITVHIPMF